jgi:hypothetical protein
MDRRVRIGLASVCAAVFLALMPQMAHAQETPSLTVTPNTGLTDGQVVSLAGTGFGGLISVAVLECPPQFADRTEFTITEVLGSCGFIGFTDAVDIDAAGNLTGSAAVQEVFTPSSGGPSYDCTVRNDCVILVAGLGGPSELAGATAPIRFGPEVPTSKAACKSGGWRNLADDQDQPFRNQGQCVSFVVSRRK